jgi:hypothetical protein
MNGTGCGRLGGAIDARSEWTGSVKPLSTTDIVTLLNAGVITLTEARGYLGLGEENGLCG